jgi:hypothetical protein
VIPSTWWEWTVWAIVGALAVLEEIRYYSDAKG